MKTKTEPKSKVAMLKDFKEKKVQKDAANRGAILLDKGERREVQGFKARQREVEMMVQPLNADVGEFLEELQVKYGVKIGVTHNIDLDKMELTPIPAAKEPDESKPE